MSSTLRLDPFPVFEAYIDHSNLGAVIALESLGIQGGVPVDITCDLHFDNFLTGSRPPLVYLTNEEPSDKGPKGWDPPVEWNQSVGLAANMNAGVMLATVGKLPGEDSTRPASRFRVSVPRPGDFARVRLRCDGDVGIVTFGGEDRSLLLIRKGLPRWLVFGVKRLDRAGDYPAPYGMTASAWKTGADAPMSDEPPNPDPDDPWGPPVVSPERRTLEEIQVIVSRALGRSLP